MFGIKAGRYFGHSVGGMILNSGSKVLTEGRRANLVDEEYNELLKLATSKKSIQINKD